MKLSHENRAAIIALTVEGGGIRQLERTTGVHRDTITRLQLEVGQCCMAFMDIAHKNLDFDIIELDESWAYVGRRDDPNKPPKNPLDETHGSQWLYLAFAPKHRFATHFYVGRRSYDHAFQFLSGLKSKLLHPDKVEFRMDGWEIYCRCISRLFPGTSYIKIVKNRQKRENKKYWKKTFFGEPDPSFANTNHIERYHLELRMGSKRLARKSTGHSKQIDNHIAAMALILTYRNYCCPHRSLGGISPAMSAGLAEHVWTVSYMIQRVSDYALFGGPPPEFQ